MIIRTLDIGVDKREGFRLDEGKTLALDCRVTRICLTRPGIFKIQLFMKIFPLCSR